MRKFLYHNPKTIEEAASILKRYGGRASIMAGGTDLLGKLKDEILPIYPEALVNLKKLPKLDYIQEEDEVLTVGALTRLEDIAKDELVQKYYSALATAAHKTASPHIREMGTLGGNICQDVRCWFYRNPYNRFPCLRKGGGRCYAIEGNNRYHSIFGGSVEGGCYAVHPSDTAPALIALDATLKTSKRTINAENFFKVDVRKTTVLDEDEIVTQIRIPRPPRETKSAFLKFALRSSIDFPIVNCAAMITKSRDAVTTARLCLNAVWIKPYRVTVAEKYITGKAIDEETAESAGSAAVREVKPLRDNGYMVQIAKTLVKRCLLACNKE